MADVVNLRLVRKQRLRAAAATEAAENCVRHGRTKAERQRDTLQADRAAQAVDDAALDQPVPPKA